MKILIGFFTLVLLSQTVLTQTLPATVDRYLKRIYNNHIIPGFSVVVIKNDQVIFSKGYGVEKTGENRLFTPATAVAVGSLTKSFTALAVMRLVENGKLRLDAPVIKYLPWFRTANKVQSDKITISMLLNNTSGLYSSNTMPAYDLSETSIETFVKNLASIYLNKEPGNSYEYSNAGFIVAGLVISKVSGLPYAAFLETQIFKPLGMFHTSTKPAEFSRMNIVPGHYPAIKSVIIAKREPQFETSEYAPAGSLLHSCADDIGKYLVALLHENKPVSSNIQKALWSPYINFPGLSLENGGDGKPFGYGYGWMISTIEGREIIHHGGSTGKTSSFTMIDPKNKIAASILMNVDMTFIDKYAYPTEFNILNNVLRLAANLKESTFGKPVSTDPTLNSYELEESNKNNYTGEYRHRKGGDAFVNFGVDMKIQKTPGGRLEGIIYRGSQTVNRFYLDFVNESVALSRNVAMPAHLTFKITAAGKVTIAFFNNIEFSKEKKEGNNLFKQVSDAYGRVSFDIPKEWQYSVSKACFSSGAKNNKALITGGILSKGKFSFDKFFKSGCGEGASLNSKSNILAETIGTFIWQQKTYSFKKGNEEFQCMLLFTNNTSNTYWFMLISSKSTFTLQVQQVMNVLLKSFRIQ